MTLLKKQVKEWLSVWVKLDKRTKSRTAKAWTAAKRKLGKIKGQHQWRNVKGPMGALILALSGIGWNPKGPAVWDDPRNNTWMCTGNSMDLEDINNAMQEDIMKGLWGKASKHRNGTGMEDGAELSGARRHLNSLTKRARYKEAGCLQSIVCGTIWTRERKSQAGFDVNIICPRCGQEPESEVHRFWACVHNKVLAESWRPQGSEEAVRDCVEKSEAPEGNAAKEPGEEKQRSEEEKPVDSSSEKKLPKLDMDNEDVDPFDFMEDFSPEVEEGPWQAEEAEPEDWHLWPKQQRPQERSEEQGSEVEKTVEKIAAEEVAADKESRRKQVSPFEATQKLEATARRQCAAGKDLCLWLRGIVPRMSQGATQERRCQPRSLATE